VVLVSGGVEKRDWSVKEGVLVSGGVERRDWSVKEGVLVSGGVEKRDWSVKEGDIGQWRGGEVGGGEYWSEEGWRMGDS
jgi:hypothetical protein